MLRLLYLVRLRWGFESKSLTILSHVDEVSVRDQNVVGFINGGAMVRGVVVLW